MPDHGVNIQWHDRSFFAELAEALRVPTDHIVGATRDRDDTYVVVWTPDTDDMAESLAARLRRDADGVLVVMGLPHPVDLSEAQATIRAALEDRLGPPDGP